MRIGLLGTLAVQDAAGRPVQVGGQRVRLLLILLALDAGKVVPAYSLIERLWEDEPPANAGNALQSLVSRLRTALRQAGLGDHLIESHPAGYRLAVPPEQVDAVAFEALARQGNQALAAGDPVAAGRALRQALDAWRGPALADASGTRFATGPAARLEEQRARAALDLIEAGLALGEGDSLIGELRAMIAADPVAERPRGLLMRALYAAGRPAEAVAEYTRARERLASELGVDPSPQLEQIYLAVLRQDLAEGPPPPDGEPPGGTADFAAAQRPAHGDPPARVRPAAVRKPLTSFVGRDEDVARVLKMLDEGRLVTLTGPGGAGKTRLALEIAARLSREPAAGSPARGLGQAWASCQVWFVELTPVSEPGDVPSTVLNALGIRESPVIAHAGAGQLGALGDPAQRLVAALAERRDLLILDNCEHVVAAAATLADQILAGCPDVRVLVTSREPLRITGEALWPVSSLPVPPVPVPGGDLPDEAVLAPAPGPAGAPAGEAGSQVAGYAAVRLLADRAAAVRPEFTVTDANAGDVARICRALDGMPLAIELAAARLRTLSAAQLAERLDARFGPPTGAGRTAAPQHEQRLDARFELLTGGSRTAAPRHQTLRAVVDWTWELLSAPEQVLARRLAAFPAGATLAAAEQVCQDGALPAEAILPAIFGLVDKSFLTVDDSAEPRYRMLETIRAYCAERLAEAGEEDQIRRAFAMHLLHLAETADPMLRAAGQDTWIRRLTVEQDNIHAALRWAIDHQDVPLALRFGQALSWFWLLRGQRRESGTIATEILAISSPADGATRDLAVVHARAVCALTALNATWDLAEVREPLADVEPLMMAGRDGGRPPHPLVIVGAAMLVLYEHRDPDRALRLLIGHFDSADPWVRAGARLMSAFFSMSLGRLDDVARWCDEGLAGFQAIGDRWGIALALAGQADLAVLDGDYARAIAALERAVELSGGLTDWEDTAQLYASLARSRSRTGDYEGALADMARAQRAAREQGESESDIWITYIQAELAWLRGDLAEAGRISRGLDAQLATKDTPMIWSFRAQAMNRQALADIRTGDVAGGRDRLAAAIRMASESQDLAALAVVVDGLAAATLWADGSRPAAERAAVLLGAAHSIRGAFDHSSLDAPDARDTARQRLGEPDFDAAYQRGRGLGREEALAFAEDLVQSSANG
ncbi:MAG TPA: BTAD domain-containing putative transcriptional regulator [Streptosporangiaceae bacterium]|nr:BTAD domain-containing putative transcriptional regulator [Streptosporangiaceae bacterium]